jgi:hypothetical protein
MRWTGSVAPSAGGKQRQLPWSSCVGSHVVPS